MARPMPAQWRTTRTEERAADRVEYMTLHRWTAELKTAGTVLLIGMLLLMTVSGTASAEGQPDYADTDNWAYFGIGEDRTEDVFLAPSTR